MAVGNSHLTPATARPDGQPSADGRPAGRHCEPLAGGTLLSRAKDLPGYVLRLPDGAPLELDCGAALPNAMFAYQTYGELNDRKTNAILVCHALTGDQYLAEKHPVTGKNGWWTHLTGPGKPLDLSRYFVICVNVVGGCMGSSGPLSIDPATGRAYGSSFPVVTIRDMARAQMRVVDHLGIDKLLCAMGGSMGGMQALQWAASYPERVRAVMPIACAAHHTPQNIAFHEVGRAAIMADPGWRGGHYVNEGGNPAGGLAVARMIAHITYLSDAALKKKFGRLLQDRDEVTFGFDADFQVESYLRHQGISFVDRFDAASYVYITRAMDYFDLAAEFGGKLSNAFVGVGASVRFCVVSFTSDWLFPPEGNKEIVTALNHVAANVSYVELPSEKGHDAFLLDDPAFCDTVGGFLSSVARQAGV